MQRLSVLVLLALFCLTSATPSIGNETKSMAGVTVYNIVRNDATPYCLAVPGNTPVKGINVVLRECGSGSGDQWLLNPTTNRVSPASDATLCLAHHDQRDYGPQQNIPVLWPCGDSNVSCQTWEWASGQPFKNLDCGKVLDTPQKSKQFEDVYAEMSDDTTDTFNINIVSVPSQTMPTPAVQV